MLFDLLKPQFAFSFWCFLQIKRHFAFLISKNTDLTNRNRQSFLKVMGNML
jgi:hypothetical protein